MTAATLSRQRAYLGAMGIDTWVLRAPAAGVAAAAPRLRLVPGAGAVLLVCGAAADSASRLAGDISRALNGASVWAWPDAAEDAVDLAAAVDEKLFTTVAVFGEKLAGLLFGSGLPAAIDSARLVLLPDMRDIQGRPEARRSLWATICQSGMLPPGARPRG